MLMHQMLIYPSEVSQARTNINMELPTKIANNFKDILSFLKDHSNKYCTIECCAFIGIKDDKFVAQILANRSPDPNSFFCVDPLDFLRFKSENELLFIFHSHPSSNEEFSDLDIANADACCLVSLIYSLLTDKFAIYEPQNHEIDVNILNKVKGLL
jgi:proteasome lid subunit RPN8/RPN11